MIKYLVDKEDAYKYSIGTNKKIKMKCPYCGYEKELPINYIKKLGFPCNICGDGNKYPNKFMSNLLREANVDFIPEFSPP